MTVAQPVLPVDDGAVRLVSLPLTIGLVALPIVFVWLLLRKGYPSSLRRSAFAYTFVVPALSLVATIIATFASA